VHESDMHLQFNTSLGWRQISLLSPFPNSLGSSPVLYLALSSNIRIKLSYQIDLVLYAPYPLTNESFVHAK